MFGKRSMAVVRPNLWGTGSIRYFPFFWQINACSVRRAGALPPFPKQEYILQGERISLAPFPRKQFL